MANCVTCKARCEDAGQHRVKTDCISYMPKDYPKPQTNADRIRGMSDEELAVWFCTGRECDQQHCRFCKMDGCHIDDWLKAPVEEVDNGT